MPRLSPDLPIPYRQRALADLAWLITRAEGHQARQLLTLKRLVAASRDTTRTDVLLHRTEDRLALLRQSRQSLIEGKRLPGADERHIGGGRECLS